MIEMITQTRVEDAVAHTTDFLHKERGAQIDGDYASRQLRQRIATTQERAGAFLMAVPRPRGNGFYAPLSRYNANQFQEAVTSLPGYFVLVPSALVERGPSAFYPAVVSEDGLMSQSLRLHVLHQAYHCQIGRATGVVLSSAGQAETKGIGEHGRQSHDGVEAEHFATLLTISGNPTLLTGWRNGEHINHRWRQAPRQSITGQLTNTLLHTDVRQSTLTLRQQDFEHNRAMLLWHEGMRDTNGNAAAATYPGALVVIQSLGYEALSQSQPDRLTNVQKALT